MMYSIKEVAFYYSVHIQSVYRWIWSEKLAAIKIGSIWRVPREALERFERSFQEASGTELLIDN